MAERPPSCRAVVFDFDGTLVDSMPMVLAAHAHAIEPYHPPLSGPEWFARLGGPPVRTLTELLPDAAHVAPALRRLEDFMAVRAAQVRPFAGGRELLATLAAAGCATGLWTGRDRATTEEMLRLHHLDGGLAASVCGDDLATHKPHPEGLRVVLQRLNVAAAAALYVGDADVDVLAGAELGLRTVLIRHGRAVAPEVAARAWRVVDTPAEAYALVAAETV